MIINEKRPDVVLLLPLFHSMSVIDGSVRKKKSIRYEKSYVFKYIRKKVFQENIKIDKLNPVEKVYVGRKSYS